MDRVGPVWLQRARHPRKSRSVLPARLCEPTCFARSTGRVFLSIRRSTCNLRLSRQLLLRCPTSCIHALVGLTHCCSKTPQGRFKLLRLTIKKRLRATLAAIREQLKRKRHEPIGQVGAWLTRVIRGYFNYHAVPDNLKRRAGFRYEGSMPRVVRTTAPTQPVKIR